MGIIVYLSERENIVDNYSDEREKEERAKDEEIDLIIQDDNERDNWLLMIFK